MGLSRLEKASQALLVLYAKAHNLPRLMLAQAEANFPVDEIASAPAPSSPLVIIVLIVFLSKQH